MRSAVRGDLGAALGLDSVNMQCRVAAPAAQIMLQSCMLNALCFTVYGGVCWRRAASTCAPLQCAHT